MPGPVNYWDKWSSELGPAYVEHAGSLRFQLVTRALQVHLTHGCKRILDVGGGYGEQAILLARLGHEVVIVDSDEFMIECAHDRLQKEVPTVRRRVQLLKEKAENVCSVRNGKFDLVCCHSVLMYVDDPAEILASMAEVANRSGIISILTLNPETVAFREGLSRRWNEAIKLINDSGYTGEHYRPNRKHSIRIVTNLLKRNGFDIVSWYGVGIFADHFRIASDDVEFEDILELEWLAGLCDPYRKIARSTHAIYRRADNN